MDVDLNKTSILSIYVFILQSHLFNFLDYVSTLRFHLQFAHDYCY